MCKIFLQSHLFYLFKWLRLIMEHYCYLTKFFSIAFCSLLLFILFFHLFVSIIYIIIHKWNQGLDAVVKYCHFVCVFVLATLLIHPSSFLNFRPQVNIVLWKLLIRLQIHWALDEFLPYSPWGSKTAPLHYTLIYKLHNWI